MTIATDLFLSLITLPLFMGKKEKRKSHPHYLHVCVMIVLREHCKRAEGNPASLLGWLLAAHEPPACFLGSRVHTTPQG